MKIEKAIKNLEKDIKGVANNNIINDVLRFIKRHQKMIIIIGIIYIVYRYLFTEEYYD